MRRADNGEGFRKTLGRSGLQCLLRTGGSELSHGGACALVEPNRKRTGAPRSPQRTWAENDMFRLLLLAPPWICWSISQKTMWASPVFPVEIVGVGEPHAAFLIESRTRETIWCRVQEIRVARLFRPTYAEANVGHPSSSYWVLLGHRLCRESILNRVVLTRTLKPGPTQQVVLPQSHLFVFKEGRLQVIRLTKIA